MKKLLKEVIKEISPTREEETEVVKLINALLKRIDSGLKDARAILGGSGAKGTWLKTFDIDIFVLYNYSKYKDDSFVLSDKCEKHLRRKFKRIKRLHGSRDYFQVIYEGYTFEIIPILGISDPAKGGT